MTVNLIFNTEKKVLRTLTTNVLSQEVKMATLGPVLSAYDLNINNICKDINSVTKVFPKSFQTSVEVTIYVDKTFVTKIKGPTITYLLKSLKSEKNSVGLVDLWRVYLIKKKFNKATTLVELLSTVRSTNLKIIV